LNPPSRHPGTVEPLEPRAYLASTGADFRAARTFGTGEGPAYVAVADFNRDGKPDVVSVNVKEGTVSVLPGNGRGSLGSHRAIPPIGPSPQSLVVADFNRDNKLDVATTIGATATVAVQFGTGGGTFVRQPVQSPYGTAPATADAPAVAVADFNGDGNADVVVTHPSDDALAVLLGNGDGSFQAPQAVALDDARAVAVGDFNGDGRQDLVASSGVADEVVLFLGAPGNADAFVRGQAVELAGVTGLKVADLNADGLADVIAAAGSVLGVMLSNGDGTVQSPATFAVANRAADVAVADFNADGKSDLAVANSQGPAVQWFAGRGDGTFDEPETLSLASPSSTVAAADLDANGKPDLVFGHADGSDLSVVLNGTRPSNGGGGDPDPDPEPEPEPEPVDPTVDLVPVVSARLPAAAIAGQKTSGAMVVTLLNGGNSTATGPVTFDLFASSDTTLNADDTPITSVTRNVKVAAGKGKSVKLRVGSFPSGLATGGYHVLARVGMPQTTETNTNNNVGASRQSVAIAAAFVDLSPSFPAKVPTALSAGRPATVAVSLSNRGNVVADGAVRVTLLASPDAARDSADTTLATTTATLKVPPSGQKRLKLKFALPADLPPGLYHFIAWIEPEGLPASAVSGEDTAVSIERFAVV
jgi:FG-GAP-like repeat